MTRVRQLILLRGMPGAGKSTFAATLQKMCGDVMAHIEGDQWRGYGDKREYSSEFNANAHTYAVGKTADLLLNSNCHIVVSNVFPTLAHLKPYFDLTAELNRREKQQHDIRVTVAHVQGPLGRSVQSERGKGCNSRKNINAYLNIWEEYRGEFDAA